MVDTPLLEQRIKDSGKKYGYLAEKLGISRQYFRMKCKNKADFTNRETDILCSELGITSLTEKEKTWVIEMNKKIIWIVGHRIDDRFKLTETTSKILQIDFVAVE